MRSFALVIASSMLLAGCATASPQAPASSAVSPAAAQLAGTQWRFVTLRGKQIADGVETALRFDDAGRASGRDGCNNFGASYLAGGDGSLHFGQTMSTRMACLQPPGAMDVERQVLDALAQTAHARMEKNRLVLLDVTGAELATLERQ